MHSLKRKVSEQFKELQAAKKKIKELENDIKFRDETSLLDASALSELIESNASDADTPGPRSSPRAESNAADADTPDPRSSPRAESNAADADTPGFCS